MKLKLQIMSGILILITFLFSTPKQANAVAVADWNETAIQTIAASSPPRAAPVSFMDMTMVHLAIFEAVNAIDPKFTRYNVEIPNAHGSTTSTAAKAAHDVLVHLFPARLAFQ